MNQFACLVFLLERVMQKGIPLPRMPLMSSPERFKGNLAAGQPLMFIYRIIDYLFKLYIYINTPLF